MSNTAGKIMPMPRDDYVSISEYNILDIVRYDNSLWIAKKNKLKNITPSKDNSDSWMLAIEKSDVDIVDFKVSELQELVSVLQSKINTLEEKLNNVTEPTETVMLDIGEITDETILQIQVNDEDYSVMNTENPQQVDNETYQFIIN